MPRYTYAGDWPAVFPDLQVGVNATVIRDPDQPAPPEGSTVELFPGDEVETTEPFESALLREEAAPEAPPSAPSAPAPAPGEETAP